MISVIFVTFWVWLPQYVNVCYVLSTFATLSHCLPCFVYDCHFVRMFVMFWVWLPYCSHVFHILSMITTLFACLSCFEHECHNGAMCSLFWLLLPHCGYVHFHYMYIQNKCTFGISLIMFATFCLLLPHCGHVCHILSTIATQWPCLPKFDYDCHTVGMYICAKCTSGPNVNSQRMYICIECTLNVH